MTDDPFELDDDGALRPYRGGRQRDDYYEYYGRDPADFDDSEDAETYDEEPPRRRWRWRLLRGAAYALLAGLLALLAWLAVAAPVSRTAQPLVPPQMILTAADGTPIARTGPVMDRPITLEELPQHVIDAFISIEDRRFYDHWGIDPRGIARAFWTNVTSDSRHGGSTITQQLVKLTYLDSERSLGRKAKEVPIALWLEAWLSKDEILERYLSNVYFGDNVYGLRAASLHYFYRHPENLTLAQAAMLAGLMKAPSRLAPTRNLEGAQARQRVVLAAMVDAGYLAPEVATATPLATVDHRPPDNLPRGTYFTDWAAREARESLPMDGHDTVEVQTTLDRRLQGLAERVARQAPAGAQVALVAMRPDGEVVAMVGGRDYAASSFNRATQAERQPGSTFKLVVYLAALRSGMTPETMVDDSPIATGTYRPANAGGRYRGRITLREAFAVSSNVVAVRLYQQLGSAAIADAAHALGIDRDFPANASVALGSGEMSLLELTSAYAAIAGDGRVVTPHALPLEEPGFFDRLLDDRPRVNGRRQAQLREMMRAAVTGGTATAAQLAIPAFGKTGTTQDSRDALFVGFAGDLVVGIWIGHDDNRPLGSASGGGAPARMWRDFMAGAIPGAAPPARRPAPPAPSEEDAPLSGVRIEENGDILLETDIGGARLSIENGEFALEPSEELQRRLEEFDAPGATGNDPPDPAGGDGR